MKMTFTQWLDFINRHKHFLRLANDPEFIEGLKKIINRR